jgi:glycosyltransferase involved in cell wall biosynthesis
MTPSPRPESFETNGTGPSPGNCDDGPEVSATRPRKASATRHGRVHVHLSFSSLRMASRAFREGLAAIDAGHAEHVEYLGCDDGRLADAPPDPGGLVVKRLPPPPSPPGSHRILRIASLPRWYASVFRELRRRRDIDLLIAHNLASLPIAVVLKQVTRARLLYDAHELETQREGWSRPIRWVASIAESLLMPHVDHTLVVSDTIRSWYERRYPKASFTTVRNTPSVVGPVRKSDALRRQLGLREDELLCVFLGMLSPGRGIEEMVEAFRQLPVDKHVVFVGPGLLREFLATEAQTHRNIHVLPPVAGSEVVSYASGADVGVVISAGKSLSYRYSLPNKLFEYAHAGLPVIVSDLPEFRNFVEREGSGWVIPPTPDALRDLVLGLSRQEIRDMPKRDAPPPSWETEAPRLLAVYQKLARPAQA